MLLGASHPTYGVFPSLYDTIILVTALLVARAVLYMFSFHTSCVELSVYAKYHCYVLRARWVSYIQDIFKLARRLPSRFQALQFVQGGCTWPAKLCVLFVIKCNEG